MTTKKDEVRSTAEALSTFRALKLALEALEECRRDPRLKYEHPYYDKTITALREALAAVPEPHKQQSAERGEPVAWGMPSAGGGFVVDCITPEEHDRVEGGYTIPLYTSPPASKPMPEDYTALEQALTRLQKRYADLEGRASKPLNTDEIRSASREIDPVGEDLCHWSFVEGIRFAEKHHGIKEKNS